MEDVAAALAAETRRLRADVKRLEARLRALESSRWHKLNPRRAWGRFRTSADTRPIPPALTADIPDDQASLGDSPSTFALERFREEVLAHGRFTHLWALEDLACWDPIFSALGNELEPRILEIGCFEGLWTCLAGWRLPDARITCIDTFAGGLDHSGTSTVPEDLEGIFDGNIALIDSSRIRKLVGDSRHRLIDLEDEAAKFALVYVDGSHLGLDVIVDAAFAWQLLTPGGFLVFDDYKWAELGEDALLRPGPAIDSFLALVQDKYETVFADYKLAVRKRL